LELDIKSKMIYCKRCQKFRGFYFKDGVWVCVGCGKEIKEESN